MDRQRAINLPPVVLALSLALVVVHGLRQLVGPAVDEELVLALAFTPARYGPLAGLLPGGVGADFWTPVTYAFLHADVTHLLVNIIWMASFGGALARRLGAARFVVLALAASVAGAALHAVTNWGDPAFVIGASGAVSGMMAGTARFAFSPGGPLAGGGARSFANPAEPLAALLRNRRATWFIAVWFVVNLVFGLVGGPGASGPIAWEAHIGGFLAGLLIFPWLDPVRPSPPLVEEPEEPAAGAAG